MMNYHPSVKSSQPIVDMSCVEQQKITCDGGESVQVSDNNESTNQKPQCKDPVTSTKNVLSAQSSGILEPSTKEPNKDVNVTHPAVVSLVKAIRLPAYHSADVPVKVTDVRGSALIEAGDSLDDCLQIEASLVTVDQEDVSALIISNHGKSICQLSSGVELASASDVETVANGSVDYSFWW